MNSTITFLQKELLTLADNIYHLEHSLKDYAPDDPHGTGNRAVLSIKKRQQRMVYDLLECAETPDLFQLYCHARLEAVGQKHTRLTQHGAAHDLSHAEGWWETLGEMQYLSDLLNRLNEYLQREGTHPPESPLTPPIYLENGMLH